jgi:hypothetical protein
MARAGPVIETSEAFGIEAFDPVAHGLWVEVQVLGNSPNGTVLIGLPDDLRALDLAGRGSAGMRQTLYGGALGVGQSSDKDRYAVSVPYLPDAPLSTSAYVSRHSDPALKGQAIGRKPLRGCGKYLITYARLLTTPPAGD